MSVHRLPDLSVWALIDEVDRRGSLGAAARALGMTQQAASAKVRGAESLLGVDLFVRSPRGAVATPEGRTVLEAAAGLLESARSLAEAVDSVRGGTSRRLTVAASNTVVEHYLPTWTGAMLRRDPGVRIDVVAANSREVMRDVVAGDVEIGFVETPESPGGDPDAGRLREEARWQGKLLARSVAWDSIVLAVTSAHPWAEEPPTVDQVRATPLLLREYGSGTRRAVEQALPGMAAPAAEVGSLSALWRTARATGIPTFLPSRAIVEPLVPVRVEGLDVGRPIRAIWRRGRQLSAVASSLIAAAEDPASP
ncbi:LysR family transcriptional regulator [Kocuria koreensis]|jgi:DNA-binding transcriptional LysR family regulator|uniref:LysR family transcriptional regulator n=1 Tax=Rothia koreensis TaxID=592378 RepID=A0A7K1LIT4_9MICC|nr:LysR family transcriptional regulator [Rothia koreensis]MUN54832.1 LysR family transcriptional regulator [Rothia koreensis]